MRRNRLAALLLLLAAAPAAAEVDLFPRPNEIFPVLVADPRHIQLSASYYRLDGHDASDVALGRSWGVTRGRAGTTQDWLWEVDLEGMAYSRFRLGGGINEFDTVDFFLNLPVTVRRGDVSFKATAFHESSHLGDDYIRRTGATGFRYSTEGVRAQAAVEPWRFLRVYAGGEYLPHTIPTPGRLMGQGGFELTSDDLHWSREVPTRVYLAEDVEARDRVGWNPDSHLVGGVKIGFRESPTRAMRVQAGWFTGHSPFGQFYFQREHYVDVSVSLEL